MFFGGNFPQIKISTATESERTLLVLKDSYANCFVPFLAPYYRTIIMIAVQDTITVNLEELMEVENIQEVLYLYNANTFFSDTSFELALTPPTRELNAPCFSADRLEQLFHICFHQCICGLSFSCIFR